MKLSELNKPATPPGSHKPEPQAEDTSPEPQGVNVVTPSGIEIEYQWAPRRLYKLKTRTGQWHEVPSVTTVLGALDKSGPLTWWGMKVGIEGVLALFKRGVLTDPIFSTKDGDVHNVEQVVQLLNEHKLTVNHVKDSAADRGVNVHGAMEKWAEAGWLPEPTAWPEDEQGYVTGVRKFLFNIEGAKVVGTELMVGSLQHSYAGRGDLWLEFPDPMIVVGKGFKDVELPAGRYLLDLKTRKKSNFYDTNFLQVEAYEAAAVECGYAPTDYRGVVVVLPDGRYQLRINQDWTFEDFLAVRQCYQTMHERQIVQALRDELGATDVAEGAATDA